MTGAMRSSDRIPRVRVLSVVKGLGVGGAEQLLVNAARVADHRRFEHHVAYVRPDKTALVEPLREAGVRIWSLDAAGVGPRAWVPGLRRLLADQRFHAVHAHSPLLAGVLRPAARTFPSSRRPAVVTTEHNPWDSFGLATRLLNAVTTPLDDHRWAVSERVKASMWPAARLQTEVLTHGVLLDSVAHARRSRAEVRAELGLAADDLVGITVANLRREKDYPNLLHAAAILRDSIPRLRLLAVGQGPLEDDVRELHRELGLDSRLRLLGFRSDVPDLMRAADFFVLASRHEGFPVAVMEALSNGLPVVGTRVGGVPEAITDRVDGLLVDPQDPSALAEAIREITTSDGLLEALSANAEKRAGDFDIRNAVSRLEQRYLELAPPSADLAER